MSAFFNTWKIATEETCRGPWLGEPNGVHFRCALCGHKFVPGDEYIAVYTNDLLVGGGNPLMCSTHRAPILAMRALWIERCQEYLSEKFWWFRRH